MSIKLMQASAGASVSTVTTGNGSIPLDQLPLRGSQGGYIHVLGFLVRVDSLTLGPVAAASFLDGAALADLIEQVSLTAAPGGPLGRQNGGTVINLQSGYLALTTMSALSGAPIGAISGASFESDTPATFDAASAGLIGQATALQRERRLYGWAGRQGPYAFLAAAGPGANITNEAVEWFFPVGHRAGEEDYGGMNPIPAGFYTGEGSQCGKSQGPGKFTFKLRNTTFMGLPITWSGNLTVYAVTIELPSVRMPLALQVIQSSSNVGQFTLASGIAGMHGFIEDLDVAGNMIMPNLTGVTSIQATYKGELLWPNDTFTANYYGAYSQLNGLDTERYSFTDMDTTDSRSTGFNGTARFPVPGRIFVLHRGPASRAPGYGGENCNDGIAIKLLGAPASTTRQLASGYWLRNSQEYREAFAAFTGTSVAEQVPVTTFGAMSAQKVAAGMLANVPAKVDGAKC